MKCRGEKSRERIVKNYIINPIAHVKLIGGQEKLSCTNDTLTNSYYCFNYVSRNDFNEKGTFFCGSHAASDFLKRAKLMSLPLFNPLVSNSSGTGGNGNGSNVWHPVAKQLNDAINMIVVCWNIVPGGALADIQSNLLKNKTYEPHFSKIKSVNTILNREQRTLQQIINGLRHNNDIRQFSFNLLNDRLMANEINSNFG